MVQTSTLLLTESAAASRLIRAAGHPPATVVFEETMVGFFVEAADLLGIPKSVAAIYGICFAASEPLSFADINQKLNISAGSISQGLRVLREVGALKEVSGPSDRREQFAPDLELRKLIGRWIEERLQKQLSAGQKKLRLLSRTIPGGRSLSAKVLRGRIDALQGWHDKGRDVLPLVKAFLKIS